MRPEFLNENPVIYLVAPSFGCPTGSYNKRLRKSIENFKAHGAKVITGPNVFLNIGIVASNTPELRAKEIMDAFQSEAQAIISVGGGEMMCDMLPFLDFEEIRKHPKWFVGFSDNANLTYTLTTICDMESVYGCNAPSYTNFEYDALDTWEMIHGKTEFRGYKKWAYGIDSKPLDPYKFNKRTMIKAWNYEGPVKGRMLGGCLDVLVNLCGTKFDHTREYISRHKDEGIIFFMECCDYNSVSLRRALLQLKNAGWFDDVSMFLIGRSLNYFNHSFGVTMEQSYKDILLPLGKPILFNIDLGHLSPSIPMRSGAVAEVEYKEKNIFISYEK